MDRNIKKVIRDIPSHDGRIIPTEVVVVEKVREEIITKEQLLEQKANIEAKLALFEN